MQARFIHDGKSIDFFPTSDVPAGSVVIQGSLIGITKLDVHANTLGALAVVGVYDVQKGTAAIALGAKVYWDATAKNAVTTATGNTLIGVAVLDAAAESPVVRVRIG